MPFFIPGATPTVAASIIATPQFTNDQVKEIMKDISKMSFWQAYLVYIGITTAAPFGHESIAAAAGARYGTQVAGRAGGFVGGVVGYVTSIAIVGGIVTAIDPGDLYEGGLAEYIPAHISEPFGEGLRTGYSRGPLSTSPHLQFIKKTLSTNASGVKRDLWTEPKGWLVDNW